MNTNPVLVEENDEEEEDFLRELAAAEAEAASAKRPRLAATDTTPIPRRLSTVEGDYTAALRGSRSELWQQSPLNLGPKGRTFKVAPTATVVANYHRSDGDGGGGGSRYGSEASDQEIAEKSCPCGIGVCMILTSNTQKNPGRKFYKCPVREENGGCGFFQWCDSDQSSGAHVGTLNYGNTNEHKFPDLQCPCGAGPCRVLTAKTGQNIGQQFYRCPRFEGSCGFFKWCNDQTVTSTTQYGFSKSSGMNDSDNKTHSSARTGSSCFKCGKEGHWARDCSVSSDHSQSLSKYGSSKSSSSAGDCYKCGKPGHWARDCSSGQSLNVSGKRERQY